MSGCARRGIIASQAVLIAIGVDWEGPLAAASQMGGKYPTLTDWAEDNIEQTLAYFRLPLVHRKHIKSTNMVERLNGEIRRLPVLRHFRSRREAGEDASCASGRACGEEHDGITAKVEL